MKIKILEKNIITPTKGTEFSAGIDVYSPIDIELPAAGYTSDLNTQKIKLGIAIEVEKDEVAIMSERSSMGVKGVTSVGNIIDSDYRGEISIVLQNNGRTYWGAKKGDKIGQIVVCKLGNNNIEVVKELSETERGEGGFGSTDKPKKTFGIEFEGKYSNK